ncbi:MAG: PAS domain S-box protein [Methylobacter sp.]|uniref:histidine kinase n=1 Tax=Candidatus Methylobacter titanis TaxID=3053457 RepID=A0AA43TQF8_9GAMM|nr:PAS domain S-box protein [Candidatus Methylobacter titanis]
MQNRRIRQGEQRFATLFEHSPEPMWIMLNRRFIDCNPAVLRVFGFPDRAAMQGISPLDISPEYQSDGEASKTKAERLLQAVEKGAPQSFEWVHLKADGAHITCFVKLVPTRLNGKPAILCSLQDITARKQLENALRDSEYRWKFAVEGSGDGLWDWDVVNNTTFFSRRWKEMIGFSDNELANHFESWEQRMHPDDKANIFTVLQAYFDGKVPVYSIEHRLRCKDGSYKWILGRGIVVSRDAEGKPLRMIGTHTDISERKQLEDIREELLNRLQKIADRVPGMVYQYRLRVDGSACFPFASEAIRDIYRVSPEDVCEDAAKIVAMLHPDDVDDVAASILNSARDLTPWHCEYRVKFADGAVHWLLGNALPEREADGSTLWHGFITDIGKRKQLETALHDSNAFNISVLDSLSAQIAVLDAEGVIVAVNEAWRQFAKENGLPASGQAMSGGNYLEACGDEASSARSGILSVLSGEKKAFHLEYPCHSNDQQCWFQMNVSPLQGSRHGVVVSHENITERLEHEHKLGLFHTLFALASDCMFLISAKQDSRFMFVNDATCQHFGMTREQLLQWRIPDWDPNFKTEADLDAVWQKIKTDKGWVLETIHRIASGREVPVELSVNYLSYNDDEYMAGYFHDITERKRVENELKASEAKFRSIIEVSPVPMALNDNALNITFLNPAFVQTFGYTLADIPTLAAWWQKAYPDPDYRQWMETAWQTSMETARREQTEFVPLELAICCKDNSVKTVMATAAAINHDFSGVHLVILYDISERKNAENKAQTASQYARSLIEASLDPLVTISAEGKITDVNVATEQVTGVVRGELIGSDFVNYFTDPKKAYEGYQQVFSQGFVTDYPLAIHHVSGKVTDVLYNASLYRDSSGNILGVFAAARDITEFKQIEAELIRSNAELEQFAYAVSHDMRQPLRMVSSYLTLIEQALAGKLDEETQQCFDFALNGAKRMDAMILSLLDYSRIGRVSADKTRISSKTALDEALAFLGPEISACGGAVKVSGEWPELLASPDELTRLLQNLIGNGLKYHRDGQPSAVDVHGEVRSAVLRVEVRDQGIGIAPDQMDRLFKVFSRLQARSRFEGTGVGLALCRKIVEHHGGSIGVESEGEGHGCVFWFELPL